MNRKDKIIGIDIGSVSISIASLNLEKDIIETFYVFHEGKIENNLKNILNNFQLDEIYGFAVTSSTPDIIINAKKYDSRVSYIKSARHLNQEIGSVLIVGGEKFGLITFDEYGEYLNYKSNTSCAAGTGSFLDQQAKRLNLNGIEEFSRVSYGNSGEIPKIASRCAVFAKTDLIHAQQEGYSLNEICDGLSFGLAKNISDTIFNKVKVNFPVIFTGGVSKNQAVVKHLSCLINGNIKVDDYSNYYGAIGAALNFIDEIDKNEEINVSSIDSIIKLEENKKNYHYEGLSLNLSNYPDFESIVKYNYKSKINDYTTDVEVDIYEALVDTKTYDVYMGIDIGSTSTKAILLNSDGNVMAGFYTRTIGRPVEAVQVVFEAIDDISVNKKINFKILSTGTTGSGRKFIGEIFGSDIILDEISAHARAAVELDSEVDTIIEIGGQDSKFTTLKNGMVTFSIMNAICAAGTGSFIEEQAKKLDCSLSEYSSRAENELSPLSSDRCTVFMERDLNHYMNQGYSVDEVLASVLHSVRDNYLTKVAIEKNIGEKIFFQGATAKNMALVAAFEQKLNKPIMVSKYCHLTGAMGVALNLHDQNMVSNKFTGIDIYKKSIPIRSEICEICTNHCKIKIADTAGKQVAFGFLCGRDYETEKYVNNNASNFDLIKEYNRNFSFKKKSDFDYDAVIGIPSALHLYDELPLWEKFFDLLSFKTVNSKNYKDSIKDGKQLAGAEFCAPVTALHGHVKNLNDKADFIFLPDYLEVKKKNKNIRRQYCYYTQYSAPVISSDNSIADNAKIISPLVKSINGVFYMKFQLYKMMNSLSNGELNFLQVSSAYDKALKFYNESRKALKKIFNEQVESLDDINVVLLGRPYTILSSSMNKGIPEIFAKLGIKTFYQDMVIENEDDLTTMTSLKESINWHFSSNIVSATEKIAGSNGIYPVFVTSFKCTPDSFMVEYFKQIMDSYNKPYLILQLDEHDSSVGYETRIEAGIRSFRNHYHVTEDSDLLSNDSFMTGSITGMDSLKGKTLLIPKWDDYLGILLEAAIKKTGIDARLLDETNDSILQSMKYNTGQCLPLNIIAQNTIDYINKYDLDPSKVAVWNISSKMSCNLGMFPHYMKNLFESYGNGMEEISVYMGEITFFDFSLIISINIYFVYMFSGMLRKMACRVRPYEKIKGSTDMVIKESLEILYDTFLNDKSKEEALEMIIQKFEKIEVTGEDKPKVAIFGDLYVRDNEIMNQNIIKTIEDNGGEAVTTPYSEYIKIIAEPYMKKWFKEGLYAGAASARVLNKIVPLLEKKYYKYFNRILKESEYKVFKSPEEVLARLNVKIEHSGESLESILKIFSLLENYSDISLFIQTNPSYCCPSLVTEAMSKRLEEITGVPIVTIEYDGTGGAKNDDIIPYLKFPRKSKQSADRLTGS